MLIWIEDSIILHQDKSELEAALLKLVMAYKQGYHHVICSPDILSESIIIDNPIIYQALSLSSRRYVELPQILDFVDYYIKISKQSSDIIKKPINQKTEYSIGVKYFAESSVYLPSKLILEDYEDKKTYYKLSEHYLSNYVNFKIETTPVNGGGSNTPKVIREEAGSLNKHSRMTLCVYDSDVKYAGSSIGGTANGILRATRSANQLFCSIMIDTHEVENLYSPLLFDMLIKDINANPIKSLLNSVQNTKPELYRYLDIKNGIRVKNIKFPNDPKEKEMYESLCNIVGIDIEGENCGLAKCNHMDRSSCNCILLNGFPNALSEINANIDSLVSSDIRSLLTGEIVKEWNKVGKILVSYFLSSDAIQV